MTAAVCLECGRMKTGAWTPCSGCNHRPESLKDRARHLIATDHYQSTETLTALSQMIQTGQKPQFVEAQVSSVMQELGRIDSTRKGGGKAKAKAIRYLLLAAVVLGLLWLWMRSR